MMVMVHSVQKVQPLNDMKLLVQFTSGDVKTYDVKPLLAKWSQFEPLNSSVLFRCVKVDIGGYGVSWNDDLDLSADELWANGVLTGNTSSANDESA